MGYTVWHKILMREILTNLTNFQQFVNIFPMKIFDLASYLPLMNLWQSGSTQNKIIISEAPPRVAFFTATAQNRYGSKFLVYSRELSLLVHPIHLYKHDN